MKKMIWGLLVFSFLITIPSAKLLAVEYSITNTKIEVYLQENGDVFVVEEHTYSFDGEFNGITRTIIPKRGTGIIGFRAYEGEQELYTVKDLRDENRYLAYRDGVSETITVELNYTIVNGVEKFSDLAQFYWPFFDDSNESTYENLDIFIYPPVETKNVIAYGYDEALGTAKVLPDGSVHFKMGEVPDGKNGDIRVAYDVALFPTAPIKSNMEMKREILTGLDETNTALKQRNLLENSAPYLIGLLTLLTAFLYLMATVRKNSKKIAAKRMISTFDRLPKERMSGPATALFTGLPITTSHLLSAALLDLIRKGCVKQEDKKKFSVMDHKADYEHEDFLMSWLFKKLGYKGKLNLSTLKRKLKKRANQKEYRKNFNEWVRLVKKEIESHQLVEDAKKKKITVGIIGILLIPYAIILGIVGFTGWLIITIFLIVFLLMFALFHRPLSPEGMAINLEWKEFRKRFPHIELEKWVKWDEEEKTRAIIYGVGINSKKIKEKNEVFIKGLPEMDSIHPSSTPYDTYLIHFFVLGNMVDRHFSEANNISTGGSSSGGSSGGEGSGVGGGGGGSGAF